MFTFITKKPLILGAAFCVLTLSIGCAKKVEIPGSGPPATDIQIARTLSGNSFDTEINGQIYQASNGGLLSFSYLPDGPQVCKGIWRVDDSAEINIVTCKWVAHGKIFTQPYKEIRYQLRQSSEYGLDMIDEHGVYVGFLPYKYGTSYGSTKHRGFPRYNEFKKLSKRLGL